MSKFVLKPSSLSKHTSNFNKMLEQAPVPKLDASELKLVPETPKENELTKADEKEQINPASSATATPTTFVFGEQLTDRVVNVQQEEKDETEANEKQENEITNTATLTNSQTTATPKKSLDSTLFSNSNDDVNTTLNTTTDYENDIDSDLLLFKVNCKLYLLESDKMNWLEKGYGLLKIFETNDRTNCKLMMWTDKTFRLILNIKLFEKMIIDKANKKSIRLNGYDNGTIKIFLLKTNNANDCDELYDLLIRRLSELQARIDSRSSETDDNEFECNCKLKKENDNEKFDCNLKIVKNRSRKDFNLVIKPNDESKSEISSQIEIIQINKENKNDYLFKIVDSNQTSYEVFICEDEDKEEFIEIYEDLTRKDDESQNKREYSSDSSESDEEDEEHHYKKQK